MNSCLVVSLQLATLSSMLPDCIVFFSQTPVLDYPSECHRCKVAGPIDLTLQINTEPLSEQFFSLLDQHLINSVVFWTHGKNLL